MGPRKISLTPKNMNFRCHSYLLLSQRDLIIKYQKCTLYILGHICRKSLLNTVPLSPELHMVDKDLEDLAYDSFLYSIVLHHFSREILPVIL